MIFNMDPQSLWRRYSDSNILQIYGRAGSGKSTLAMHFAKYILSTGNQGKLFWVDTERKLSSKRLQEIVGSNTKSIFISQPKTYLDQQELIKRISSMEIPISALVIDTISRYFRSLDKKNNWRSYSENLQSFYENHILPLLIFQEKTNCYLILIHQITSVPEVGDKPFMYKVFEEIESSWIAL